jgi:hypothetical protein
MDLPSSHFTHVFTNFGVELVPSPRQCLNEIYRVLLPGGINAFTHWESVGWYSWVGKGVASLASDGDAPPYPAWSEFASAFGHNKTEQWYDINYVVAEIEKAGFVDLRKSLYENKTTYKNAREFWALFGHIFQQLIRSFWSEEQREKWYPKLEGAMIKVLGEEFGDGEVTIDWSAWVIVSKKPDA